MSTETLSTALGWDPDCPHYQAALEHPDSIGHECRRRDGRLVRPGIDSCHAGAVTLLRRIRVSS